jgi:RNA polymerase sigma-70 factor (ECF subfamily)
MDALALALTSVIGPPGPAAFAGEAAEVAAAAVGDVGAFERLYRRHLARIHGLARRMAGPEQAEELTQEVFVRAWQKLGTFRGEAAFGTWLHRVAVHLILGRRSAQQVERRRRDRDDAQLERMASPQERPDLALDFESAIDRLPEGARQIFVLHDVEGHKHEEIANLLGISTGTSKSQLHHARLALRRHLGTAGPGTVTP